MDDFNEFWRVYPRKTKKGDARKAFDQAMRITTLGEIVTALAWQVKQPSWTRDNGEFIPYPATYLRAEQWADEPLVDPRQVQRTQGVAELNAFREAVQRRRESA